MIKKLIEDWAPKLEVPEGVDPCAILWAIYRCEKYSKGNRQPRYEPTYAPGGVLYERSGLVQAEYAKWGAWAACSFSNFQILYITAVELGYQGPPLGLDRDEIAVEFVVRYLNWRVFERGCTLPEQVADAYNSGSFADDRKPLEYMKKFLYFYKRYSTQCLASTNNVSDSSTEQQA